MGRMRKAVRWLGPVILLMACEKPIEYRSEKQIMSFKLTSYNPDVLGVISETDQTIRLSVPNKNSIKSLRPTIEVSAYATVDPASGTAQDFSRTVRYTVTAEDGSTQPYTVTAQSSAKQITSFVFKLLTPDARGTINQEAHTINVTVPANTKSERLQPAIVISEGASLSPRADAVPDFAQPVTYTVTAEDGSQQTYLVTVNQR